MPQLQVPHTVYDDVFIICHSSITNHRKSLLKCFKIVLFVLLNIIIQGIYTAPNISVFVLFNKIK